MAAQEYYQSFQHLPQTAHPPYPSSPSGGGRPSLAPLQNPPQSSNYSQPQYLKPILKNANHGYPAPPPWSPQQGSPYQNLVPYQGPAGARPSNPNLLAPPMGYPLAASRSKSEPPENRRSSHHHHHHRHHSRSRSRSRSRSGSGSRSSSRHDRSQSRSRSRHHSHSHSSSSNRARSHSNRDTFIGAGAGGLIGDALLPGLGTLWGALAGGYGGHEYSHKKTSRSKSDSGYKDGITVNSGWLRR